MLRKQTLIGTACLLMVAGFVPRGFAQAEEDPLTRAFGHLPTMDEAYGQHDNQQSQTQGNEDEPPMVGYSANSPTTYTPHGYGSGTISGPQGNVDVRTNGGITTFTESRPGGAIRTKTCVRLANGSLQCP